MRKERRKTSREREILLHKKRHKREMKLRAKGERQPWIIGINPKEYSPHVLAMFGTSKGEKPKQRKRKKKKRIKRIEK